MWELDYLYPVIEVSVPSLTKEVDESGREKKLYRVEVLNNGRKHYVLRRHSDFQALHRKLKKNVILPDFPSKRSQNLRVKPLDQRRQELESYIQEILHQNQVVPQEVLDFLQIKHFHLMNKGDNVDNCELVEHCVVTFSKDAYFLNTCTDLPDVVVDGVLDGLFAPKEEE